MERVETDREKRSRVLLQTVHDLVHQDLSIRMIAFILKEPFGAIKYNHKKLQKAGLCAPTIIHKSSDRIRQELIAVIELRNAGLPFGVIASILKISWDTVAQRVRDGKVKGLLTFHFFNGHFETREERMEYITFFVRLGMTGLHIASVLDIEVTDVGNDYTEIKKRIGKAYRSWEYPLQQCYDAYRSFLGYETSLDDIPDLTDDMRLRASVILQSMISEKIHTFLEQEDTIPSDKEFCDPFDRIGKDVYGSENGHWRTARELWNEAYEGLWECIKKEYGILPHSLDELFRLIDTMYKQKIHTVNQAIKQRRALLREALARLSKYSQSVLWLYYGLETGYGISANEISRIFNFERQRFYQIRKRFFKEIRNPQATKNPIMENTNTDTLPLTTLGLSKSMIVRLEKRGVETLGDFRKKSVADLCIIPYIGPTKVKNLEMKLWRFGIKLAK